jgi:L-threonylcarbamoyladenylate synthase
MTQDIQQACQILHSGGVIAYATEAVFGLGCDPDNEAAVHKLLQIKLRPIEKGLILIAAEWQQLIPYLDVSSLSHEQLQRALNSWPGPYTWVFPAKMTTPKWLTGEFSSLAVRVSAHPQVRALCQSYGKPLVSTSANLSGEAPCRSEQEVKIQLGGRVDFIMPGEVGGAINPSEIRDVLTGKLLRPA